MEKRDRTAWHVSLAIVLLAAVYVGAGKLGLSLASVHASATPVWPATGISLAALLILGYRVWPGVFLGALGRGQKDACSNHQVNRQNNRQEPVDDSSFHIAENCML